MLKRLLSIIILFALGGMLFAQGGKQGTETPKRDRQLIDIKADLVFSHKVDDTTTVLCFVGNFAAQHNGAIITADSAVRYSDKKIECFGNVLINKNTTYAYADRAEYDGELNEAALYSPVVKVMDEDVTLYSFNFRFNTLENYGWYWEGGITSNKDNLISSERGYYYSDRKELVCVEAVEIRGDDYQMKGDSVIYNLETDYVDYFQNTNIWNSDGDYIYADRGSYDREQELYTINESGYMLTAEQEAWSDTMEYYRSRKHAILRSEIQLDDTTHKALAFGDYGELWGERDDILLTKRPLVISYDLEQGDSLYLRADTILLLTHNSEVDRREVELFRLDSILQDSLRIVAMRDSLNQVHIQDSLHTLYLRDSLAAVALADSLTQLAALEALATAGDEPEQLVGEQIEEPADSLPEPYIDIADTISVPYAKAEVPPVVGEPLPAIELPLGPESELEVEPADSLNEVAIVADSLAADTIVKANLWQRIRGRYTTWRKERAAVTAVRDSIRLAERTIKLDARDAELEEIATRRQEKINIKLDAEQARAARAEYTRKERYMERENRRRTRRGEPLLTMDSLVGDNQVVTNHTPRSEERAPLDSLDSLAIDSLAIDSLDSLAITPDSIYRHIKAFSNVRIYRSDFQSLCDSMVSISCDTTMHLYIEPVLWNGQSQITSEVMDVYTRLQKLERAEFVGRPIMGSQIDTTYYNQVSGKVMIARFNDNEIYRNDVDGNVQTIYFQREEDSGEIDMMVVVESGTASFYISNKDLDGVTYRGNPRYDFYPMDKIPAKQSLTLDGFKWRGDERPEKEEFLFRERRPSIRDAKSALPHPQYPIETLIRGEMAGLIEAGMWQDRHEVVSYEDEEWMNSLGYTTGQPRKEGDNPFK